ncbi:MAG: AAA domain-containing protein [Rhodospirillales bacterium]
MKTPAARTARAAARVRGLDGRHLCGNTLGRISPAAFGIGMSEETPEADDLNFEEFAPTQGTWIETVCGYFRDFLDTDLKRTRAPKRSLSARDSSGLLTGIALSKYPEFNHDLRNLLEKPFGSKLVQTLKVQQGKYMSRLSGGVRSTVQTQINSINEKSVQAIADAVLTQARDMQKELSGDPDEYADRISQNIRRELLRAIVNPLLSNLDAVFKNQGNDSFESIYDLEEELGENLTASFEEGRREAVAGVIVGNDFDALEELVRDVCSLERVRVICTQFFENYATNDFFKELSELNSTLKLKENFQVYIYICALRHDKKSYPLVYFPVEVYLQGATSKNLTLKVDLDSRLFINKRAIDFAVGEINRSAEAPVTYTLKDRTMYVAEGKSIIDCIGQTLGELTNALGMNGSINLRDHLPQRISRAEINIDNSLHFAAFDKADESLLNDYEELLTIFGKGTGPAADFEEFISSFMTENPESYEKGIDQEWAERGLQDKLVYDSPVPLNEEQRKIISGLNKPDCRFIAVEGPPGTGKSHTITACVFDAILRNKNVLVLSDKKEALDVVEKKIRETLKKVRRDKDVEDPILRLGKHGNTFNKIMTRRMIDKLENSLAATRPNKNSFDAEMEQREKALKNKIEKLRASVGEIDMARILEVQKNEAQFKFKGGESDQILQSRNFQLGVTAATCIAQFIADSKIQTLMNWAGCGLSTTGFNHFINAQLKISKALGQVQIHEHLKRFGRIESRSIPKLAKLIDGYNEARMPIVGYLFSKSEKIRLNRELSDTFDYKNASMGHRQVGVLLSAHESMQSILKSFNDCGLTEEKEINLAFRQMLASQHIAVEKIDIMRQAHAVYAKAMLSDAYFVLASLGLLKDDYTPVSAKADQGMVKQLQELGRHIREVRSLAKAFESIPDFDYVRELAELEKLHTRRLADMIDERVVEFANENRQDAEQIKGIIRRKQKFPQELFSHLLEAFPIIIAGIRDYAEYVPLESGLFDLIIIDEASQVSIAQALPAFVRAKKILVLGDSNQFSNVKAATASNLMNRAYKEAIKKQYQAQEGPNIAQLNQVSMFDVKTSVLNFVEYVVNLKVSLRKHFRGYPELISFSSKYFYQNDLQAVKIRGKRIDEVITFTPVEHDDLIDVLSNTNQMEADLIIDQLSEMAAADDDQLDVMVVTPFSGQQKFILQTLHKRPNASEIIERLKLRVFTFDTCQGEEAHTVIYSLVATRERDRLNMIFPRSLDNGAEVEENLRLQRLNVGFSRAKERIWIFHSKPVEEYSNSIRTALQHFQRTLEMGRRGPDVGDVDPRSPMEKKVLNWLRSAPVIHELGNNVEIDPQFEIGVYLKQLDPTYRHPKYKVDFLVKVHGGGNSADIIIEYDGFEHFDNLSEVDAFNYQDYMKPADIERQKILEGYGYQFLRINRYNVGENPVKTLDERLRRLIERTDSNNAPA